MNTKPRDQVRRATIDKWRAGLDERHSKAMSRWVKRIEIMIKHRCPQTGVGQGIAREIVGMALAWYAKDQAKREYGPKTYEIGNFCGILTSATDSNTDSGITGADR